MAGLPATRVSTLREQRARTPVMGGFLSVRSWAMLRSAQNIRYDRIPRSSPLSVRNLSRTVAKVCSARKVWHVERRGCRSDELEYVVEDVIPPSLVQFDEVEAA